MPQDPPGPPPPSSSPTGAMEGESTWDDGLAPLFPPAVGSSSWGLNLYSQLESTNGVQAARTGMESVDLNSQAGDFPHLNDYESYLRGGTFSVGGGMESALAPNRCNRSLGVHRRDAGWSQRGRGGGGRRGQQLDFGGGRAGSMASAPPGGAFVGPSSSGAAAGARAIAPPGAAGGKMRGTSAYSSRGGASSSGHARSSRGRGRHRGQRMPREDFYYLQEEDEEAENEFEDLHNSRGQDGDSSEDGDEDELPYENDVYASEDGDEDELQYENDQYPSEDEESTQDGRKSSSEDEIIKMARNNLKRDHEFTMQTMAVFVFKDATLRYAHKFPHPPPGKLYCVDAGYPNRPGYLSPYRGTKYLRAPFKNAPSPKDENYVPGGYDNDFEDELELNTQDEEPIIEDTDMNAFRDEIADALFYK
ncbi:unnamed protein product [Urochloa humidicola]